MPHEPKKRHSRARQGKRRTSIRLELPNVTTCTNCGNNVASHTVCPKCGYYKGIQVLAIKEKNKTQTA